jgi:hypothetical protein
MAADEAQGAGGSSLNICQEHGGLDVFTEVCVCEIREAAVAMSVGSATRDEISRAAPMQAVMIRRGVDVVTVAQVPVNRPLRRWRPGPLASTFARIARSTSRIVRISLSSMAQTVRFHTVTIKRMKRSLIIWAG